MNFTDFDSVSLIGSAVVVLLSIISPLLNPFFRFRRPKDEGTDEETLSPEEKDSETASSLPYLSIVIAPHDQAEDLEKHLPTILHQDYPAGYQVIVVTEVSDHDTNDVLKRFQLSLKEEPSNASLYVTSILDSSRFMSRKKLAITLGVKAASSEWVLLTDADCEPASDKWLQGMGSCCDEGTNLVIGYSNYDDSASAFKRFERLHTAYYLMREDVKGTAYRTNGCNLMFRKEDFMKGDGYLGNLQLIRGEYDFIVNKYAVKGGTGLCLAPEAWVIEDSPSKKAWLNKHVFYLETRKHLQRSWLHRLWFNVDQLFLHVSFLSAIAGIVFGILTGRLLLAVASVLALLILSTLHTVIGRKATKDFQEKISPLCIFPYQLGILWHNLSHLLRHRMANKLEFSTHKQ
jgi:GT2 family glycosyltransferase